MATLLAFAEATNADFVADDLALYDAVAGCVSGSGFGRDEVLPEGPIGLRDYLAHNLADGRGLDWGLLKPFFRRSVLYENAIAYDENISHGEDFKLVVDLLMRGATFRLLAQPLYLYTQRSSGMSRTSIGYGKLKAAALALAEDSRIAADAELVALLRRRARGLGRLDDAHFLSTALRQGALGQIALRSFRDLSFMPFMLVQIARALRRRLRIRGARGHGTGPRGLPYR